MNSNETTDSHIEIIYKVYTIEYYNHQYNRMNQLEFLGIAITALIILINFGTFIFGFIFQKTVNISIRYILLISVIVLNIFAIFFIKRITSWERTHRRRAKKVLEKYAPDLYTLDRLNFEPHQEISYEHEDLQIFLHIFWILLMIILFFIG